MHSSVLWIKLIKHEQNSSFHGLNFFPPVTRWSGRDDLQIKPHKCLIFILQKQCKCPQGVKVIPHQSSHLFPESSSFILDVVFLVGKMLCSNEHNLLSGISSYWACTETLSPHKHFDPILKKCRPQSGSRFSQAKKFAMNFHSLQR